MDTVINLLLIATCAYAIFVLFYTHQMLRKHDKSLDTLNSTFQTICEMHKKDDQGGEDNDVDDSARVSAEVHDEDKINS